MRPSLRAVLAALSLLACRPHDTERAAANPPAGATTVPVFTVVAKDFSFDAPADVPAGITTIRLINQGLAMHHVVLMRLANGKTVADLAASMKHPGPLPTWAVSVGGPNAPVPGGTSEATLLLEPGSYVLLCVIPSADQIPHFAKGMVSPLTVTASATSAPAPATEPPADLTLTLTDYAFAFSTPVTGGAHTVRVENRATQDHEAFLVRLAPGKTAADLVAWIDKQAGPPPAEPLGGLTALAAGSHVYFTQNFTPGHYALLCFVPDAKDGKAHVAHGMTSEFTIS